jgi:hypothetical protein
MSNIQAWTTVAKVREETMPNLDYVARALGRIADQAIEKAKIEVNKIQADWTVNSTA